MPEFYALFFKDIRPGLFTGFLTISGFLMSAHTFIIIHMKKEMYDTDAYKKRIARNRKLTPSHSFYGSLLRLSRFLMWAVLMSLAASLCQVTLGLYEANWAAATCLVVASIAFGLVVASVIAMAKNMKAWFEDLEEEAKATHG